MELLQWKQADTWGREYLINLPSEPLGALTFEGWASYNAVYTSGAATIQFKRKGWFEQEVDILQHGERVAVANTSVFGKTQVQLKSGETYRLESETFSNNRSVCNAAGRAVINFRQPTFSFGKGEIDVADDFPETYKEVLVSTSLYLKLITDSTVALIIMFLLFYVIIFN